MCKHMLDAGKQSVSAPATSGASGGEAGSESASASPGGSGAKTDLCAGLAPKYMDMCRGYEKYLTDCPSFKNDICHEDIGGTERLRSPCPAHLKCYYCLRINPLYCLTN